jgi:hypothetical protein
VQSLTVTYTAWLWRRFPHQHSVDDLGLYSWNYSCSVCTHNFLLFYHPRWQSRCLRHFCLLPSTPHGRPCDVIMFHALANHSKIHHIEVLSWRPHPSFSLISNIILSRRPPPIIFVVFSQSKSIWCSARHHFQNGSDLGTGILGF